MTDRDKGAPAPEPAGTPAEVFVTFLRLGLTSFGGPVAHLGYFRAELVTRRRWLTDQAYADLVTLCQFLPGPASSQVGFALGLMRAGWLGALAAFAAKERIEPEKKVRLQYTTTSPLMHERLGLTDD